MKLLSWLTRKSYASSSFRAALTPFYESGRPAAWADDPSEQVRHFRHWVFAAVRTIANRVAATPLYVYRREGEGVMEVDGACSAQQPNVARTILSANNCARSASNPLQQQTGGASRNDDRGLIVRATSASRASGGSPFHARGSETRATLIADPAHAAVRLLNAVNPFHTRYWLWSQTITFPQLTGNAYWYVPRNGLGALAEVWVCPSQFMRVIPDQRDFVRGYEYQCGGRTLEFSRDEIIHLKLPNPSNLYYGQGPLQAAAETVDSHEAMKSVQRQMMKRGAWPGGVLETESRVDEASLNRLRAQMESKYSGADNAGKWLVLEAGLKAREITLTPNEMAFAESAQLARDEILAIFGVPAAVMGLSKDVNRAVADAMDTIFARYCVAPLLQLIEDQINQDLMPLFDPSLFVKFETPVIEDQEILRRIAREDFMAGLLTRNEARAEGGYDGASGGDRFYIPTNRTREK